MAGGEGVGVVTGTGGAVTSLKVGDWVVPSCAGFGECNLQPFVVNPIHPIAPV